MEILEELSTLQAVAENETTGHKIAGAAYLLSRLGGKDGAFHIKRPEAMAVFKHVSLGVMGEMGLVESAGGPRRRLTALGRRAAEAARELMRGPGGAEPGFHDALAATAAMGRTRMALRSELPAVPAAPESEPRWIQVPRDASMPVAAVVDMLRPLFAAGGTLDEGSYEALGMKGPRGAFLSLLGSAAAYGLIEFGERAAGKLSARFTGDFGDLCEAMLPPVDPGFVRSVMMGAPSFAKLEESGLEPVGKSRARARELLLRWRKDAFDSRPRFGAEHFDKKAHESLSAALVESWLANRALLSRLASQAAEEAEQAAAAAERLEAEARAEEAKEETKESAGAAREAPPGPAGGEPRPEEGEAAAPPPRGALPLLPLVRIQEDLRVLLAGRDHFLPGDHAMVGLGSGGGGWLAVRQSVLAYGLGHEGPVPARRPRYAGLGLGPVWATALGLELAAEEGVGPAFRAAAAAPWPFAAILEGLPRLTNYERAAASRERIEAFLSREHPADFAEWEAKRVASAFCRNLLTLEGRSGRGLRRPAAGPGAGAAAPAPPGPGLEPEPGGPPYRVEVSSGGPATFRGQARTRAELEALVEVLRACAPFLPE